jgi:hypothetical protein
VSGTNGEQIAVDVEDSNRTRIGVYRHLWMISAVWPENRTRDRTPTVRT